MVFRDRCIVVNKIGWGCDRMLRQITLCAAVVLASTGVAGSGVAKADGLDPIAVRQAMMSLQGGDFAYIRAVLAAKGDVKPLEVPAKAIIKSTAVIAKAGDADEVAADTKLLGEQCGACHKAYRAK
jgi:cytochrome c556